MRSILLFALLGCSPTALSVTAEHPASPDAAPGRLAGPPPALRPGVADAIPSDALPSDALRSDAPPKPSPAPPAAHPQGHP
jgi:hypothetical protein